MDWRHGATSGGIPVLRVAHLFCYTPLHAFHSPCSVLCAMPAFPSHARTYNPSEGAYDDVPAATPGYMQPGRDDFAAGYTDPEDAGIRGQHEAGYMDTSALRVHDNDVGYMETEGVGDESGYMEVRFGAQQPLVMPSPDCPGHFSWVISLCTLVFHAGEGG